MWCNCSKENFFDEKSGNTLKIKLLRSLDFLLMLFLVLVGLILRPIAWIFRKDNHGILIVRPGGMGDLIYVRMAEENILYPEKITYLIEKRSEIWAKSYKLNYVLYDEKPLRTILKIAGKYQKVIVTEQFYGAACAYGLLAKKIGGTLYGFTTQRLSNYLDVEVFYDETRRPEILWFYELLIKSLENPLIPNPPQPRKRHKASDGTIWIGIAGTGVQSRELDLNKWVYLVRALVPDIEEKKIFIACTKSDLGMATKISENIKGCSVFKGGFSELCNKISSAELLICMDGGIAHIAAYEGVPVIAVFTSGIASKWFPYSCDSVAVLSEPLECQPCTKFGKVPRCVNDLKCKNFSGPLRRLLLSDLNVE